jgi:2,4-dienoyl-CoA reductase-like NADH-dependent reductase (Old Yellow Enzyme family)
MENTMSDKLIFESYSLNGLLLKNRMVMAPMTRSRSNNPENVATELTAKYYGQRASAGLIITEGTFVSIQDSVDRHLCNTRRQLGASPANTSSSCYFLSI